MGRNCGGERPVETSQETSFELLEFDLFDMFRCEMSVTSLILISLVNKVIIS